MFDLKHDFGLILCQCVTPPVVPFHDSRVAKTVRDTFWGTCPPWLRWKPEREEFLWWESAWLKHLSECEGE